MVEEKGMVEEEKGMLLIEGKISRVNDSNEKTTPIQEN